MFLGFEYIHLDDEEMPAARDADEDDPDEDDIDDGNITNDVGDTSSEVRQAISKELGRGRGGQKQVPPYSPVRTRTETRR